MKRMSDELSVLVGLALRKATRSLDLESFQFGDRRVRRNRIGEEIEVGDYALHVQCAWRIIGPAGVVVGSEDRNYVQSGDDDPEYLRSDAPSRCESKIDAWFEEHATEPLKVERVEVDHVGGFKLWLERGFVVEAMPLDTLEGEYSERWRLFVPAEDDQHFVVTGYGIEK